MLYSYARMHKIGVGNVTGGDVVAYTESAHIIVDTFYYTIKKKLIKKIKFIIL